MAGADVRKIDLIERFRDGLVTFCDAAVDSLCAAELDARKTAEWLERDGVLRWQKALRDRYDEVAMAKSALARKLLRGVNDRPPDETEEKKALRRAELRKEEAEIKLEKLKRLGDVSLYTAGFFSESLSRKIVDVDYYIEMGKTAYGNLLGKPFNELTRHFNRFVDVLAEISEETGTANKANILRLYEIWLKTRSEKAEKGLKEAGVIPNFLLKPDWQ